MTKQFKTAPLWANVVYVIVEKIQYFFDGLGGDLMWWKIAFMDRHCKCSKCLERNADASR